MEGTVYKRGKFIVVKSMSKEGEYYFTIVNIENDNHSHVYKSELIAAIMICKSAHRKSIPNHYPKWMKESIRRLLNG